MRYSTVVASPSAYACMGPLIQNIQENVRHTSEKNMTISTGNGIIVITSNSYIDEMYQDAIRRMFDSLVGKGNYTVWFNRPKPQCRYTYTKYL